MKEIKIYTMKEYCEGIRQYFELYNTNELSVQLYGNPIEKLKEIIGDNSISDMEYIVRVEELIGSTTRVLRGDSDSIPFLDWIGGENESFTRKHFENSMHEVWKEIFD